MSKNITPENLKFCKEWFAKKGITQGFTQAQATQLAVEVLNENAVLAEPAEVDKDGNDLTKEQIAQNTKELKMKVAGLLYFFMNGSAARQAFESEKILTKSEVKTGESIAAKFASAFE